MNIRFNYPYKTGKELDYVKDAMQIGRLAGDGPYTKRCHALLEGYLEVDKVLLTHSCTAALEMSAILLDIREGDEIIMPSYTFVSTANAFVLRGGVPVFIDVDRDSLNLDVGLIEQAITERTRAICVVHYAGACCDMDAVAEIASRHGLYVVEDAAQALGSEYKGKKLGSLGDISAFSFHETKNIISGEGGALVLNNSRFHERAEIIWEKGTDRSKFFRGEVDKYTWVDIGSSFLPSELVSAFLLAQLERIDEINQMRIELWNQYHQALSPLASGGELSLPVVPDGCKHNAHMFYIILNTAADRDALLDHLKSAGIGAVFHYIPLHSTRAGRKYCRTGSTMTVTDECSAKLLRLPVWPQLGSGQVAEVCELIAGFFQQR